MAQKYYNVKETAQVLGISENEVKQMQANRRLHGYRDGPDWKFKVEDIDELARERSAKESAQPEQEEDDVLLSEVELGAGPSGSGTVIGVDDGAAVDSDIRVGGDAESAKAEQEEVSSKVTQFEELDLALEEDLSLDEPDDASTPEAAPIGDSNLNLTGDELDDDDLVLGGSGAGSDITIGGDSGISLVDPTDSGLPLDEPLELGGSGSESLELGEDDMLVVGEQTEAPAEPKAEDDFLLTPLDEAGEDESESGSQVIALDTEGEGEGHEAATMIAGGAETGSMAAMLDEDLSAEPAGGIGVGPGLGGAGAGTAAMPTQPGGFAEGAPVTQPSAAALPEVPYSAWNIFFLALCVLLLTGCGMFMYDLLRNMWSWDSAYSVNSSMMDTILSWFE